MIPNSAIKLKVIRSPLDRSIYAQPVSRNRLWAGLLTASSSGVDKDTASLDRRLIQGIRITGIDRGITEAWLDDSD